MSRPIKTSRFTGFGQDESEYTKRRKAMWASGRYIMKPPVEEPEGIDLKKAEDYAKSVDRDLEQLFQKFQTLMETNKLKSSYFYIRRLSQSAQPTAGTGVGQIDTGELLLWRDPDDNKTYLVYNDTNEGVRKIELT